MPTNSCRNGTTHACLSCWPWWNHQMADPLQLYESGPHRPPAASEGPPTAQNAWNSQNMQRQSAWLRRKMRPTALLHGTWRMHVVTTRWVTSRDFSWKSLQGPRLRLKPQTSHWPHATSKKKCGTVRRAAWLTQDVAATVKTWLLQSGRGELWPQDLYMGQKPHMQTRGLSGPYRPISTNSCQNDAAHAHMAEWSRWDHQMADLPQLLKSGPRGPPATSDGSSSMYKAYVCQDDQQDVAHRTKTCVTI